MRNNNDFDLDAFLADVNLDSEPDIYEPSLKIDSTEEVVEETRSSRQPKMNFEEDYTPSYTSYEEEEEVVEEKPAKKNPLANLKNKKKKAKIEEPEIIEEEAEVEEEEEFSSKTLKNPTAKAIDRKRKYKRSLRIFTLVLAGIFLAALVWLWIRMANYQKKVDAEEAAAYEAEQLLKQEEAEKEAARRAPQLTFIAWRDSQTAESWTDLWYEQNPEDEGNREMVEDYMTDAFAADAISSFRATEYTSEKPVYVIKNGEDSLIKATLTGSGKNWTVSETEFLLKGEGESEIRVATGTKVFCNGEELGEDYIVSSDSSFDFEPLKDKLVNPVSLDTYKINGMLVAPVLTAEAPEGKQVTQTADGDFLLCLDSTAADAQNYISTSVSFVQKYFYYYLSGGTGLYDNYAAANAYLTEGTQAYSDLKESLDGVYWNGYHNNIDTTDVTADSVIVWADNCYSVDVTYHITGNVSDGTPDPYDGTMRIYWVSDDAGTFRIEYFTAL